jgi:hypothetical protein
MKIALDYQVTTHWSDFKEAYNAYVANLMCVLHDLDHFSFTKSLDDVTLGRSKVIYNNIKEGIRLLSEWSGNNCLLIFFDFGNIFYVYIHRMFKWKCISDINEKSLRGSIR